MPATQDRRYYVYILTNSSRTLYVGITNNLERRMYEHKNKLVSGFTKKYNVTWLAYYEETSNVESAIAREKQIKGWRPQQEGHADSIGEPAMEGPIAGMAHRLRARTLDSSLRSE